MKSFKKSTDFILDLFFPVSCLNCNLAKNKLTNPQGYLCLNCFKKIEINSWAFCPKCNKKLINLQPCQTHKNNPLKILGAATFYENKLVKKIIWEYKYNFIEPLVDPLNEILKKYYLAVFEPELTNKQPLVTFIPLYPARYRWRGFNQSEVLAKKFALDLNLEFYETLKRKKFKKPQMEIKSYQARFENIKNSFEIIKANQIKNKDIILIDDISTTGATLIEAAKVLKQNGAKKVYGLVVAKG
ncbi:MAG TPA: phosphoribosyltransferase family protein [Candidatus Paceibacterota bacterium]|nr:ComF family protein [Parcubacteria group bacterium]HOM68548.1 phosphoribosyltransferase family protein [Candidatus Paceibacterota bacterium]HRS47918.1 phosphoribosyltransferase family protein [Candidatus Paceibacterota bacterium]